MMDPALPSSFGCFSQSSVQCLNRWEESQFQPGACERTRSEKCIVAGKIVTARIGYCLLTLTSLVEFVVYDVFMALSLLFLFDRKGPYSTFFLHRTVRSLDTTAQSFCAVFGAASSFNLSKEIAIEMRVIESKRQRAELERRLTEIESELAKLETERQRAKERVEEARQRAENEQKLDQLIKNIDKLISVQKQLGAMKWKQWKIGFYKGMRALFGPEEQPAEIDLRVAEATAEPKRREAEIDLQLAEVGAETKRRGAECGKLADVLYQNNRPCDLGMNARRSLFRQG